MLFRKITKKFFGLTRIVGGPLTRRVRDRGAVNSTFAQVYYGMFARNFKREQKVFLAGCKAYEKSLTAPSGSMALLRRNVHRLEKGILMKPRRIPFARGYIEETVTAFCSVTSEQVCSIEMEEFSWAQDVLEMYFDIHSELPELEPLKKQFTEKLIEIEDRGKRVPYSRSSQAPISITYEEFSNLASRRRSVRWFQSRKVERQLIDQCLVVAAQSPSACNRQPFRFHVFDDPQLVEKIAKIPMGTAGYSHQIPVIAAVIGQQRNYFNERDRHVIYIDSSLAAMSFILALETVGLSSCCINWPDIESKERIIEGALSLAEDERVIMFIAIGYADEEGLIAYSSKKGVDEIRKFN